MELNGKKIIVGVSGSIAAYKAALLVRGLIKAGAEVQVLMTPAAAKFISSLTLSTLSKRPVYTSATSEEGWNNHVELGLWADAIIVAPATANTLAKMANGFCDNMLTAVYLSARCPVFFAPAMDLDMWAHPATQANVARLQAFGHHLIDVAEGELASGLVGAGRLAEPEDIIARLDTFFYDVQLSAQAAVVDPVVAGLGLQSSKVLSWKAKAARVLITAGPTYEPLDPVRYLGNHSTGTMGVEIAKAAASLGAKVTLVLGPSKHEVVHPNIKVIRVTTAVEMYEASVAAWPQCTVGIMAAAVADYRPATVATEKIKKKEGALTLELVRNPDIAKTLGEGKRADQQLVGFAMETENGLVNARQKLLSKHLDFIVLNSLRDQGAGFGEGTNRITIVTADGEEVFPVKTKAEVAMDILAALA